MRVTSSSQSQVYYLFSDHLGSLHLTVDPNGALHAGRRYYPFGAPRATSPGSLETELTFTGQREQTEIGLFWIGSRWYDGQLGRWAQPDTIVPEGGPQAWDRYAYVNNSPVIYNDPSGHKACDDQYATGDCVGGNITNLHPDQIFRKNIQNPIHDDKARTGNFGEYRGKYEYDGRDIWHPGSDFGGSLGTRVYPIDSGIVVEVGWETSLGNYIVVKHSIEGKNYYSVYGHLGRDGSNETGIIVSEGDNVVPQRAIGMMGNTTNGSRNSACVEGCMDTHLHLEVRQEANVNLAEGQTLLYGKDWWIFNDNWRSTFLDTGSFFGYAVAAYQEKTLP